MGTSENKISQAPEALSRPSLLSTGAPSADHNILDAMPGRNGPAEAVTRAQQRQWLWWLLLPLLAAAAWGISTQRTEPPAARPVHTAAVQPVSPTAPSLAPQAVSAATGTASTRMPQTAAATAAPASGASPDPFQSLAAAPAVAPATPAHAAQADPVTGLQASLHATTARPAPAPKASNTTAAAKKPAAPQAKTAPQTAKTSPSKPSTTAVARKAPAPHAKPAATTMANAKGSGRDPDVELLSAIMKHLGDGKGATTAAAPTRSPQTIAELVKSCRTKDAIEALMCQRRICEGSWGKAQACPKEQAPKVAKTDSPT